MSHGAEGFNVSIEELEALVEQARPSLDDAGYQKLKAAVRTLSVMTAMLESPGTTVQSLRNMFGGGSNEKTATVLKNAGIHTEKPSAPARPKAPGHGRNGANAYRGAHRVQVPHPSLRSGDRCPECEQGKVYLQRQPGVLVRLIGRAPIEATIYELEKLRCNLCGEVFTAKAPDGIGTEKYDVTVGSMIAILRYGRGFPMHRLEKLEHSLGIPLPASVQWEMVGAIAIRIRPVYDELVRQAAQGDVLYNDDTSMPVLSLRRDIDQEQSERTGIFTSGIVSTRQGLKIVLFFTGRQHAGENLRRCPYRKSCCVGASDPDVRCALTEPAQDAR